MSKDLRESLSTCGALGREANMPEVRGQNMKIENKLIGTYIVLSIIGLIAFIWVFNSVNSRFDQFDRRMETSKKRFGTRFTEAQDRMNKEFTQMAERQKAFHTQMEKELTSKRASMKQEFDEKAADFLKEHKAHVDDFDRRFSKVHSVFAKKRKDSNSHD